MATSLMGLRERKRMQTRVRLEEAAVSLVLRDGLEQTTVEAISAAADVSPRTFFNYFDSKDRAILGLRHADVDDEALAAQLRDDVPADLAGKVVHLMLTALGPPHSTPALREGRREVLRRHPQLVADQLNRIGELNERLTVVLASHLSSQPRFADLDPGDRAVHAELLLGLCGTAIRLALRTSTADDEPADSEATDDEPAGSEPTDSEQVGDGAEEADLEQRAVVLVSDLMERVTWTRH